jgi:hypothetical protein
MSTAVGWASDDLTAALAALTPQQARGVVRIVVNDLAGLPFESLFSGPDKMCSRATYHGRKAGEGWKHKDAFQAAVSLARRDYRRFVLEESTTDALVTLAQTAPEAAQALRQQVVGDPSALAALEVALQAQEAGLRINAALRLGETGLPQAGRALAAALVRERDETVKQALVEALGKVAGWVDGDRRAAAFGVLDRAAGKTASKQVVQSVSLDEVSDDDLGAIEGVLRAQAAGSRPAQ